MKTCPLCETAYPSHHTNCPTDGALLIESRQLEPGTVIRGKYRIERQLGRGGMGTVYLAEHILLGRQRALKFISSDLSQDATFLRRFRREAQAATQLQHPNVVQVVDLDQSEDGSPYMAMEYVEGPDLRHALAAGAFPVERALAIARGIAQGLGEAHAKGIIHRDVKPENILLAGGNGVPEIPKLLDFGIAAMKESTTAASRTHGLMLTPQYASPEQWKGMASELLDGRADLYALGGVLNEMLTGQTSYHSHNTEGWMYQHLQEQPQPPSQLRPELANWPGLDDLVLRLLAKDREQRPRDAADLVRMLDAVQYADPLARRKNVFEPPPTLMPEHRATTFMPERRPTPPPFMPEPSPARSTLMPEPGPTPLVPEHHPMSRSRRTIWFAAAAALIVAALGIWFAVRSSNAKPATAQPVFTPAAGTYAEAQPVVISDSTPNAVIHYTVDGSTPTEASPIYKILPITSLPSGAVLSAMATAEGHAPSADVTGVYHWASAAQSAANGAAPAAGGSAYDQGKSAYDQGKSAYDKKQYGQARTLFALARKLFSQACNGGEKNACNYLGYMYAQGEGGALDQGKAREVYQKGCELGNFRSCTGLGYLYAQGLGGARDQGKAREVYQKACDGGLTEACDDAKNGRND
jgi:serine/threonine protein kinase